MKEFRRVAAGAMLATAIMASGSVAFAAGTHHRAGSRAQVFIQVVSKASFSQTVSQLKHAVAANGMMVLGTLNQKGALSTTGLKLKGAESFFIGNPVIGAKLFKMDPAIGTEIPARVYVWVNAKGKTELGYFNPTVLFSAVSGAMGKQSGMIAMALSKIVHTAAK